MAKFKINKSWINTFNHIVEIMDTNRCQLDLTPTGIDVNIIDCTHTSLICIKNIKYNYDRIDMDFQYKNINDKPIYLEQLYYTPLSKTLLKNCTDTLCIESDDLYTTVTCFNEFGKFVVENSYVDEFTNLKIPTLKIENKVDIFVPEFLKIIEPFMEFEKTIFELKNNELFVKYNSYKINYEQVIGVSSSSNVVKSIFTTDLLSKIVSVLKQMKILYVSLYIGNDIPMIVEFNTNLATIQIIVAPRIEND